MKQLLDCLGRLLLLSLTLGVLRGGSLGLYAQEGAVKRQPYVDLRRHYLGFRLGMHTSDLRLNNTGLPLTDGGQLWADVPSYQPGFHIGVIGGLVIVPDLELRLMPTLQLGSLPVAYTDGEREVERYMLRTHAIQLPLELKWGAMRWGNYRPFLAGGAYSALHLGGRQGDLLRLRSWDYGLSIGAGCDIYFAYFKLSPQLTYYHGLGDVLQHHRPDLKDDQRYRYTEALRAGHSRMLLLTLSFE